jgi:hypothetical protein
MSSGSDEEVYVGVVSGKDIHWAEITHDDAEAEDHKVW